MTSDTSPDRLSPGNDQFVTEVSPWHILRFLVRNRRVIASSIAATVVLVVGLVFVLPKSYVARFSFSPPAGTGSTSQIASIAAQFGMSLGSTSTTLTPAYYAGLVNSRVVQDRVSARTFVGPDSVRGSIADIVKLDGATPEIRRDQMAAWLTENVKAEVTTETGVIKVSANAPSAGFAFALASAFREEIHRFNQDSRRAQATAERQFIVTRVTEAARRLADAEEAQRRFLERNRQFQNSPELRFENDRLQREVVLRQSLYASLSQALQQAEIAEVRDTPLLTIIDEPALPALPVPKRLIIVAFLAAVLGTLLGLGLAMLRSAPEGDDIARQAAYREVRDYARSWIPRRFRRSA